MIIDNDLKKLIEHGDWTAIANLYNQTHSRHVTSSYVLKIVNGERSAKEGTAAAEILLFTEKYLKNKKTFRETLIQES